MQHSDFRWIIQKTLTGRETLQQLIGAVEQNNATSELIDVIPFDPYIHYTPKDDRHPIIYGSSTFMYGSYRHPYLKKGVFYDPETFRMSIYLQHWGDNMLNADAVVLTASRLHELDLPPDHRVFVRPDDDSKSFSGMVCCYEEALDRFLQLDMSNPYLHGESELFLSSVKEVDREWRCFIVKGRVVSASRYRIRGETRVDETDIPEAMIGFAEELCRVFAPHDIFVMDVALHNEMYKVVECNCFNSSGTYRHYWGRIVRAVQEHIIETATM